ncbi:MAG: Rieske 2Fe-2S domain-containing protein [Mycobacteriales bacterium]|nr:MAG: hypothetical protein DLM56_01815 [Pseudonocardiales bacterium]
MRAVRLRVDGRDNCVVVDGVPYVFARTATGAFVLPSRCPHRGGPLQLAQLDGAGRFLRCPWHGRRSSLTRFREHGVPAVRSGNDVVMVLDVGDDASVQWRHTPVAPALRTPGASGLPPSATDELQPGGDASSAASAATCSSAQPRCSRRAHASGTAPVRIP